MMYKPNDDLYFQKVLLNKNYADDSIKTYEKTVKVWYNATGKTLKETVNEIQPLQKDKITNNYIIRYDPNTGKLKQYFDEFHTYLIQNNKAPSTIKYYIKVMRFIFKELGLQLPKAPKIKVKKSTNKVLTKSDIQYILNISNIYYKSLYCFLATTGIRISDAARFTINDFISATFDYHNCHDLEEFLEKNHEPMIGYWEFVPQKTRESSNVVCKVCNSYESNEYIIRSIHEIIKFIETNNKNNNTNILVEGNDPLFPTQKEYFKTKINREAVVTTSLHKNQKLQEKLARDYQTQYENNNINNYQYNKLLNERPHFHAHALRTFFINTIRAYCPNRDISLLMEAHKSNISTDENYLGESQELFNKDMITEYYIDMVNHLTFNFSIDPDELENLKLENQRLEREKLEFRSNLEDKVNNAVLIAMNTFWKDK